MINRISDTTFDSIKPDRGTAPYPATAAPDRGKGLKPERYRTMRLHLIPTEPDIESLNASDQMNA